MSQFDQNEDLKGQNLNQRDPDDTTGPGGPGTQGVPPRQGQSGTGLGNNLHHLDNDLDPADSPDRGRGHGEWTGTGGLTTRSAEPEEEAPREDPDDDQMLPRYGKNGLERAETDPLTRRGMYAE